MNLYVVAEINPSDMTGEVVACFQNYDDVKEFVDKQPEEKSFRIYVKEFEL